MLPLAAGGRGGSVLTSAPAAAPASSRRAPATEPRQTEGEPWVLRVRAYEARPWRRLRRKWTTRTARTRSSRGAGGRREWTAVVRFHEDGSVTLPRGEVGHWIVRRHGYELLDRIPDDILVTSPSWISRAFHRIVAMEMKSKEEWRREAGLVGEGQFSFCACKPINGLCALQVRLPLVHVQQGNRARKTSQDATNHGGGLELELRAKLWARHLESRGGQQSMTHGVLASRPQSGRDQREGRAQILATFSAARLQQPASPLNGDEKTTALCSEATERTSQENRGRSLGRWIISVQQKHTKKSGLREKYHGANSSKRGGKRRAT